MPGWSRPRPEKYETSLHPFLVRGWEGVTRNKGGCNATLQSVGRKAIRTAQLVPQFPLRLPDFLTVASLHLHPLTLGLQKPSESRCELSVNWTGTFWKQGVRDPAKCFINLSALFAPQTSRDGKFLGGMKFLAILVRRGVVCESTHNFALDSQLCIEQSDVTLTTLKDLWQYWKWCLSLFTRCVQKITRIFVFRGFGESYCQNFLLLCWYTWPWSMIKSSAVFIVYFVCGSH